MPHRVVRYMPQAFVAKAVEGFEGLESRRGEGTYLRRLGVQAIFIRCAMEVRTYRIWRRL